jgi:hypothetical protein
MLDQHPPLICRRTDVDVEEIFAVAMLTQLVGLHNDSSGSLTRLTNAHVDKILSVLNFDICGFTGVITVVLNTKFKLVVFTLVSCMSQSASG